MSTISTLEQTPATSVAGIPLLYKAGQKMTFNGVDYQPGDGIPQQEVEKLNDYELQVFIHQRVIRVMTVQEISDHMSKIVAAPPPTTVEDLKTIITSMEALTDEQRAGLLKILDDAPPTGFCLELTGDGTGSQLPAITDQAIEQQQEYPAVEQTAEVTAPAEPVTDEPNPDGLDALTVQELKDKLTALGQPINGNKQALLERLRTPVA